MTRITTAEAVTAAQVRGYAVSANTCRKLARQHGLTVRLGRKLFFDAIGWERLLVEGLPDCHRDVPAPQG
jgi:hypothetical protein